MEDRKMTNEGSNSPFLTEGEHERYVNPYTDFGFKKLFGTEVNKELLISLLNALFDHTAQLSAKEPRLIIRDLRYMPTEKLEAYGERRAVFDVYCEGEDGERVIVEMQKASQDFFKDRSVFYSAFPIIEQGKVGHDWDFRLNHVYTVGILNFVFPGNEYSPDCLHHEVKLMDVEDNHGDPPTMLSTSRAPIYDKLTYVYLEMPKFNKNADQLETMYDKWLFVLKNLSRLLERPAALQERVFQRLFDQAEIARLTPDEVRIYEESLKHYRDLRNVVNSAERKGREEGRAEGLAEGLAEGRGERSIEIARSMKADGLPAEVIMKHTGLTREEISAL